MKNVLLPLLVFLAFYGNAQNCVAPNTLDRTEVSDSALPVPMIAHLVVHRKWLFWGTNDLSTCSMISPNVFLTAGHSLRNRWLHSHVTSVTVMLGRRRENGTIQVLAEQTAQKKDLSIVVNPTFRKTGKPEFDYSYASLPTNLTTAFFPLAGMATLTDAKDSVFIEGYPGDKQQPEGQLWIKGDLVANLLLGDPLLAKYRIYTVHGDSGAPIWAFINGRPTQLGVHGTGNIKGHINCNAGILLTPDRIAELNDYINQHRH